jgi:hypothetical protein
LQEIDGVQIVVTKKGDYGIICGLSNSAVVIAYYGPGQLAQEAIKNVTKSCKDLKAAGY